MATDHNSGGLIGHNAHIQNAKSASETNTKRKPSETNLAAYETTIKRPIWAYIHLQHLTPASEEKLSLDAVTAHLHLTASLRTFLGMHGAAIPIDLLDIQGQQVWIRVPADDRQTILAAVGGWSDSRGHGWRVRGSSAWSASAAGKDAGQDLFNS
jgi:ribonuclease P/MRP protein subunit POP8